MVKIFITGFRHSGTTMLHQLLKAHPQVGWIDNEESFIEFDKPKEWVLMHAGKRVSDLKNYAWGEKIPWGSRETDVDGKRAIGMIKKWLKYFRKNARVIHILRHPMDVALSGRGGTTEADEKDWKFITTSTPKVINYTNDNLKCATIVYEDLVINPKKHLPKILTFLNLDCNDKIINDIINTPLEFGRINSDRAYNFKNKHIKTDFDYEALKEKVKNRL